MTGDQFLNGIEGCLNDYEANLSTKDETIKHLMQHFMAALEPISGAKKHLELFIYRVRAMRALQREFFDGKRSVLAQAKVKEAQVDNAISTMLDKMGYSVEEIEKKSEQKTLY